MKRICVLGNFSGRNAGDAAILGCLVEDIYKVFPDVEFLVPTIKPEFVKNSFAQYPVRAVSLLPWSLSLKIFGLPTFRSVLKSDLVLITDNILFDRKLFNPFFNYLSTLSLAVPLAKKTGVPTVFYNASLGPIATPLGRYCLNQIVQNSDLLILRDIESKRILDELQIQCRDLTIAADCALNTQPSTDQRVQEIIEREQLFANPRGTIGVNVNSYIDVYVRNNGGGIQPERFVSIVAEVTERLIRELQVDILFVITQVMDLKIARAVVEKINTPSRVKLISNERYSYKDLAGVMSKLEILVGMRTHSLILAAAVHTPVAGIISYPKTIGFMQSINQEQWLIGFDRFNAETFYSFVKQLWEERARVREKLTPTVEAEKQKARESVELLRSFL